MWRQRLGRARNEVERLQAKANRPDVSADVLRRACDRAQQVVDDLEDAAGQELDPMAREAKFADVDALRVLCDEAVDEADIISSSRSAGTNTKRLTKPAVSLLPFCGADPECYLRFDDWRTLWEQTVLPLTQVEGERLSGGHADAVRPLQRRGQSRGVLHPPASRVHSHHQAREPAGAA